MNREDRARRSFELALDLRDPDVQAALARLHDLTFKLDDEFTADEVKGQYDKRALRAAADNHWNARAHSTLSQLLEEARRGLRKLHGWLKPRVRRALAPSPFSDIDTFGTEVESAKTLDALCAVAERFLAVAQRARREGHLAAVPDETESETTYDRNSALGARAVPATVAAVGRDGSQPPGNRRVVIDLVSSDSRADAGAADAAAGDLVHRPSVETAVVEDDAAPEDDADAALGADADADAGAGAERRLMFRPPDDSVVVNLATDSGSDEDAGADRTRDGTPPRVAKPAEGARPADTGVTRRITRQRPQPVAPPSLFRTPAPAEGRGRSGLAASLPSRQSVLRVWSNEPGAKQGTWLCGRVDHASLSHVGITWLEGCEHTPCDCWPTAELLAQSYRAFELDREPHGEATVQLHVGARVEVLLFDVEGMWCNATITQPPAMKDDSEIYVEVHTDLNTIESKPLSDVRPSPPPTRSAAAPSRARGAASGGRGGGAEASPAPDADTATTGWFRGLKSGDPIEIFEYGGWRAGHFIAHVLVPHERARTAREHAHPFVEGEAVAVRARVGASDEELDEDEEDGTLVYGVVLRTLARTPNPRAQGTPSAAAAEPRANDGMVGDGDGGSTSGERAASCADQYSVWSAQPLHNPRDAAACAAICRELRDGQLGYVQTLHASQLVRARAPPLFKPGARVCAQISEIDAPRAGTVRAPIVAVYSAERQLVSWRYAVAIGQADGGAHGLSASARADGDAAPTSTSPAERAARLESAPLKVEIFHEWALSGLRADGSVEPARTNAATSDDGAIAAAREAGGLATAGARLRAARLGQSSSAEPGARVALDPDNFDHEPFNVLASAVRLRYDFSHLPALRASPADGCHGAPSESAPSETIRGKWVRVVATRRALQPTSSGVGGVTREAIESVQLLHQIYAQDAAGRSRLLLQRVQSSSAATILAAPLGAGDAGATRVRDEALASWGQAVPVDPSRDATGAPAPSTLPPTAADQGLQLRRCVAKRVPETLAAEAQRAENAALVALAHDIEYLCAPSDGKPPPQPPPLAPADTLDARRTRLAREVLRAMEDARGLRVAVYGNTGAGKTAFCEAYLALLAPEAAQRARQRPAWQPGVPIVEQPHFASAADAHARLQGVGLSSIPSYLRAYEQLSGGERARADLARQLGHGTLLEDLGALVDIEVARSVASAVQRASVTHGWSTLVSTSSIDVVRYLCADLIVWVRAGEPTIELLCASAGSLNQIVTHVGVLPSNGYDWDPTYAPAGVAAAAAACHDPQSSGSVAPPSFAAPYRTYTLAASPPPGPHARQIADDYGLKLERDDLATRLPETLQVSEEVFSLGVFIGPSGSGKTQLAARCARGRIQPDLAPLDDARATVGAAVGAVAASVLGEDAAEAAASERLDALELGGLRDRTLASLSSGELAMVRAGASLHSGAIIDEFCSQLDPITAEQFCARVGAAVRGLGLEHVLVASARSEVAKWLVEAACDGGGGGGGDGSAGAAAAPAGSKWAYGTSVWVYCTRAWRALARRDLRAAEPVGADGDEAAVRKWLTSAPHLKVTLRPCQPQWYLARFSAHHYLDSKLNRAAYCMLVRMRELKQGEVATFAGDANEKEDGEPVGFVASIPHIAPNAKRREHRLVVLPDAQGRGLGSKISNCFAELHDVALPAGGYCSVTSLPNFARSRDGSALWRASARNGASGRMTHWPNQQPQAARATFTHVYQGASACLSVGSRGADESAAAKRPAGPPDDRRRRQGGRGAAKRQKPAPIASGQLASADESDGRSDGAGDSDEDMDAACANDEAIARALGM